MRVLPSPAHHVRMEQEGTFERPNVGPAIGLAASVIVQFALCVGLVLMVVIGVSTTCGEPASRHNVDRGLRALLIGLAVVSLPWLLATALTRQARYVALAVVGASPLLVASGLGLRPDFWVGSLCF